MTLKKPKAKDGKKITHADKRKEAAREATRLGNDSDENEDEANDDANALPSHTSKPFPDVERDVDDPYSTLPIPRYNAMLAVLKNTLYMWVSSISSSEFKCSIALFQIWGHFRERAQRIYSWRFLFTTAWQIGQIHVSKEKWHCDPCRRGRE